MFGGVRQDVTITQLNLNQTILFLSMSIFEAIDKRLTPLYFEKSRQPKTPILTFFLAIVKLTFGHRYSHTFETETRILVKFEIALFS